MHCFANNSKKATNNVQNVDVITVNIFFCHWLKEIDARCYTDNVRILPTNNTVEIYQYAAQQLKHLPKKSLHDITETLLYEKKAVNLNANRDRRSNTSTTSAYRTDASFGERITDFLGIIGRKIYYRIPLGFFTFLGLVNFSHKIDTQFLLTLENNLNRLFKTNGKLDNIPNKPDAQIMFHDTPYISSPQQITIDDNFLAYLSAILRSRSALRTGINLPPYKKALK